MARRSVDPRSLTRAASVVAGVLALHPGTVSAHAVGGARFEAPVPLAFLLVGAGVTVTATALLLWVTEAESAARPGRRLLRLPAPGAVALRTVAGVAFLALVAAAVAAGLTGRQVATENLATVFVPGVWLKGLAVLAVLVGDPWPALSPWRTLHAGLSRLEGRELAVLGDYPDRLGSWPAVVAFLLGVGVVTNLTVTPRSPRLTALAVVGYATAMLLGGIAFGRAWFRRTDLFAVFYRLLGRVAPLEWRRADGGAVVVSLRRPWRPGPAFDELGAAAFVVAAVYVVSFDAFTNTRAFQRAVFAVRDALGVGPGAALLLFAAGVALFGVAFGLAALLTSRFGGRGARVTALAVAPTLLPIAAAYELAHAYPFVVQQTAATVGLLTGATVGDPLSWLSLPVFWASQVVLIVLGHVAAVVAAHAVLARWDVRVGRTHVPLTALMVAYTMVSLWVVSRPVVA